MSHSLWHSKKHTTNPLLRAHSPFKTLYNRPCNLHILADLVWLYLSLLRNRCLLENPKTFFSKSVKCFHEVMWVKKPCIFRILTRGITFWKRIAVESFPFHMCPMAWQSHAKWEVWWYFFSFFLLRLPSSILNLCFWQRQRWLLNSTPLQCF